VTLDIKGDINLFSLFGGQFDKNIYGKKSHLEKQNVLKRTQISTK
jgi:hypothetical protein